MIKPQVAVVLFATAGLSAWIVLGMLAMDEVDQDKPMPSLPALYDYNFTNEMVREFGDAREGVLTVATIPPGRVFTDMRVLMGNPCVGLAVDSGFFIDGNTLKLHLSVATGRLGDVRGCDGVFEFRTEKRKP